jgi:hypothetical protein
MLIDHRMGVRAALCLALIFSTAPQVCAGQTAIATKRNHGLYISIFNKSGNVASAQDEYCVSFSTSFSTTRGGGPAQVSDVFVEFAQQVGRIRERPIKSSLSSAPDNRGRYCGQVNLGKQYYQPAFYHVEVHYADRTGKRRACHFFLAIH